MRRPRRPNSRKLVEQMAAGISPRDTFVLYAAAHGYSVNGRYYLIPQDYQGGPNPEALQAAPSARTPAGLDRQPHQGEEGAHPARHLRVRRADERLYELAHRWAGLGSGIGRLHEATGRPVLTAAAQGQSALEFQDIKHGIFTAALIDGLHHSKANPDGVIMLSSLVAHVQDLVPRLVDPKAREALLKRGAAGDEQSVRFGSRGEDFAVVRRLQ